jgi:hypothetical protein
MIKKRLFRLGKWREKARIRVFMALRVGLRRTLRGKRRKMGRGMEMGQGVKEKSWTSKRSINETRNLAGSRMGGNSLRSLLRIGSRTSGRCGRS